MKKFRILPLLLISSVFIFFICSLNIDSNSVNKLDSKNRFNSPNLENYFGTDAAGRDVFNRIIAGTKTTIKIAFSVILIALFFGLIVGTISGYFSGIIDNILMWITDVFLSFPSLILALAINAAMGPGIDSAIFAVGIAMWPSYAKLLRTSIKSLKNEEYILSSKAMGASNLRVIFKHILPNSISPIIVQCSLDMGYAILAVSGLSFLGIGAQPPTSEWGFLVAEGQATILSSWWWSAFPGIAICYVVISFNLFGENIRDILLGGNNV
jgi:peptide/nickel transport system permease protein|tara:strand:+ start:989 stop:1792 length:804 start_codon:yes stop_codon:yes gene_type:complete